MVTPPRVTNVPPLGRRGGGAPRERGLVDIISEADLTPVPPDLGT
jgi:hypothetical protein